jgi:hypothetical protein
MTRWGDWRMDIEDGGVREQKAESKKQKAESRKQKGESRKQKERTIS